MRVLLILAGLALAAAAVQAQPTRYVTDSLKLESRTGPGVENRIVRMLESGTPVTVLDEAEGWSRIRLPGGGEAWILTRYLMSEPPARGQLAAAIADRDAARAEFERLRGELAALEATNKELVESRDAFVEKSNALAAELDEIRRTSASAIAVRDENRQLKEQVRSLSVQLDALQRDFTVLRDSRRKDWFIAGAGVLVSGLVLGLIIPRIRWKRRRSWSEL